MTAVRKPAESHPADSTGRSVARKHAVARDLHRIVGARIRAARVRRGLTLSQLGGEDLSRSFLSAVENGRTRISLSSLALIAARLELPVSHFVDEVPDPADCAEPTVDQVRAAVAYSRQLRRRGKTEEALEYALWAAQTHVREETASRGETSRTSRAR